jgi:exopolyphosphatase / guanosine-5'-triphosphate,3'-diphosphate pyrophosphatase
MGGAHRAHDVKLQAVRCACVDIGSNTTRLLVGQAEDGRLREVTVQRAFTRICAGRRHEDPIPATKIAEVADVVAAQVRLARGCGAEQIRIVGTAAVRGAPNRDQLAEAVAAASGLYVEILDEDEEARLAFIGATRSLTTLPLGEVGVVDVGGGSSELVAGTLTGGVSWSVSLDVGSGLLADAYLHSDPPSAAEIGALRAHIAGAFAGIHAPRPRTAYAVGGSATSLYRLLGPQLTLDVLDRGLEILATTSFADLASGFDLHLERIRLLPAGILLLRAAAETFCVPLTIAPGGLREGVVFEELARRGALAGVAH